MREHELLFVICNSSSSGHVFNCVEIHGLSSFEFDYLITERLITYIGQTAS